MATHEAYIEQHYHKYHNKHLTKSEILSTLSTFTDLRPKYDKFVFSDNTRKDLFCLDGTIPVIFKGATFNIPICIWLFETHPFNPPMCYVRPTPMMMIKPSKHVDANGKVYLPYLHEWKHPKCDLIGLIQVMTIIFGENSPVYSLQASQPPGMPRMTTPYPGSHPPPSQALTPNYPQPMVQHWVNLVPSMGNMFQRMQIMAVEDKRQGLSKKLTESDEQRQQLTGRLKTTEGERQQFKDTLHTTEVKIQQLTGKLKTTEEERQQLKDTLHTIEEERQQLTGRLKTTEEERQQFKDTLHTTEVKMQQLSGRLKTTEEVRQQLKDTLHAIEEERQQLTGRLKTTEEERQQFKDTLHTSEAKIQHITGRLKTTEEERQHIRYILKRTENKLKTLKDEKDELLQQQKEASSASVMEEERETLNVSQESSLAAGYGRLIVDVADDLTLDSCVKLATLFRLPPAETDILRRIAQTETPGITLMNFLQTRNIINMYDVTNLQKALVYIKLNQTNENLLVPYQSKLSASSQSKVDPFRFDEN